MSEPLYEFCWGCRKWIPPERAELHLAGLDGARPECPRQDLEEIAQRARAENRVDGMSFIPGRWQSRLRW